MDVFPLGSPCLPATPALPAAPVFPPAVPQADSAPMAGSSHGVRVGGHARRRGPWSTSRTLPLAPGDVDTEEGRTPRHSPRTARITVLTPSPPWSPISAAARDAAEAVELAAFDEVCATWDKCKDAGPGDDLVALDAEADAAMVRYKAARLTMYELSEEHADRKDAELEEPVALPPVEEAKEEAKEGEVVKSAVSLKRKSAFAAGPPPKSARTTADAKATRRHTRSMSEAPASGSAVRAASAKQASSGGPSRSTTKPASKGEFVSARVLRSFLGHGLYTSLDFRWFGDLLSCLNPKCKHEGISAPLMPSRLVSPVGCGMELSAVKRIGEPR
ncbi:hypothetical protein OF83DRAFT_1087948 [Amylostereum chailletii]|nr:hypothetical protein OF83DRAFT_1087948 [Amylostereum chailletii]